MFERIFFGFFLLRFSIWINEEMVYFHDSKWKRLSLLNVERYRIVEFNTFLQHSKVSFTSENVFHIEIWPYKLKAKYNFRSCCPNQSTLIILQWWIFWVKKQYLNLVQKSGNLNAIKYLCIYTQYAIETGVSKFIIFIVHE